MWNILKADLSYYKSGVIILYGAALIFFFLGVLGMLSEIIIFFSTMAVLFWVVTALMGTNEGKEKHVRIHSLLPVSVKDLARVQIFFLIFLQAGIFLLGLLLLLVTDIENGWKMLWDILFINALVLIIVNIFIIYHDLRYSAYPKGRFYFTGAVILLLIIFIILDVVGIMSYPLNFNCAQPKSLAEVIIAYLVCIILFWWDYRIFLNKVTFIE